MPEINAIEWKSTIETNPDCSLLQTAAWGELKSSFGWSPIYLKNEAAAAMVLFRKLPKIALGMTIAYVPRGPLVLRQDAAGIEDFWSELIQLCRSKKAVFLRVEPDQWEDSTEADFLRSTLGEFMPAFSTIQPPRTILISLSGSQDDWLARMNQKTRYNIRLSQKKELEVSEEPDVSAFIQLIEETGSRDNFSVHSRNYYQLTSDLFRKDQKVFNLVAKYQGQPLAALMLFIQGKRGYYLYGASSAAERNRMPNHLLQWTAMQICAEHGCTEYDLWGVPDESPENLEAQFDQRSDGLWNVYRFKRGFGGEVKRTMGSFDYPCMPALYRLAAAFDRWRRKRSQSAAEGQ